MTRPLDRRQFLKGASGALIGLTHFKGSPSPRNEAWLGELHDAMQPFTSDQSYQNFIDGAETNYLRAYYGANLERLVDVKRKYDPNDLFRFPQSIPLSL
jgi:FAD/FMN-containing dehydrogenase